MSARILFLAPQPFYQERGTPIAVRMALEALTSQGRPSDLPISSITLVAYSEGEDIEIPGVTIDRVQAPRFLRGVGPGISWRKIGYDILMSFKVFGLLWRKRKAQFTVIHAIEESVFIAAIAKIIFGIPYIYDMDSSLSAQLTEQWRILRPLRPIFEIFEKFVIRNAVAVAPVCDSLKEIAERQGARITVMLRDVSLLAVDSEAPSVEQIRKELGVKENELVVTYVGNLEPYQGVHLLVESFARIATAFPGARLAIVGGREIHQSELQLLVDRLQLTGRVTFLGPRPVRFLRAYLKASDVLAAPRIRGNNTPMKIYSYLHSGRPMVATKLHTHTQVLDERISFLVEPTPQAFGDGLSALLSSAELRKRLGQAAEECAELNFTPKAFRIQLESLYRDVLSATSPATLSQSTIEGRVDSRASEKPL